MLIEGTIARKIANCALEIVSTSKKLTDIAAEYGFGSYDTFTRAFKRQTGIRPSELRHSGLKCGRKPICSGVFVPVIYNIDKSKSALSVLSKVEIVEKAAKPLGFRCF
ncbi:helix-turn-helix domain-containing protein [Ruminiclostridium hungatei]|uniref:helix-turn-helix domain-containing protein n=1 Tax=Ruminiclostridium hungatei TaxID=48256 RepID=UPI001F61E343|nr:helix-turn-helix domain-containing protein [Ruminiclostridium hungatei]